MEITELKKLRQHRLIDYIDNKHRGNIRECSIQNKIDYSSLYKYYHGTKLIGDGAARGLCDKLNLTLGYFDQDNVSENPEQKSKMATIESVIMAPVKLKEFKVCAGPGLEAVIEETREIIGIPWKILKSYGLKPEQVFAAEVDGASMVPTYNSEDYIFVATTDSMREIKNYEPYLVKYDFELMVKRLEKIGNTVTMKSDNQDKNRYPDRVVQEGIDFDIVGRIIAKMGM